MSSTQTEIEEAFANNDLESVKSKLQSAIDLYYTKGKSPLSDLQFDDYLETYIDLSGDIDFRNAKLSAPALKKAKTAQINFPALCAWLHKSNDISDTERWLTSTNHSPDDLLSMSFKYDGMSIVHEYHMSGSLQYAVTRGDSELAVDYTEFFKDDVNPYFDSSKLLETLEEYGITDCIKFAVKYEACISYENLAKINAQLPADKQYKNPRNTVAGLLRKDDGYKFRKYVSLIPLDIEFEGYDVLNNLNKSDRINILQKIINPDSNYLNCDFDWWVWWTFNTDDTHSLDAYLREVTTEYREHCPYMLDGIVLEYDSADKTLELGGFSETPPHVLGWKFPRAQYKTKVISCDWDYGRTGRRTPVINFEPVVINGNTYSRTSIANLLRFDELTLRTGSPILFELRGEVIGYITLDTSEPPSPKRAFTVPESITTFTYNKEGNRVYAYSPATIADRVERFIIEAGIKGIKAGTIDALVSGLYKLGHSYHSVAEFIAATFEIDITAFDGIGESKANYYYSTIEAAANTGIESWRILSGLGIISIGSDTAKKILYNTEYTLKELADIMSPHSPEKERKELVKNLLAIDGLGEKRLTTTLNGILTYSLDIYNFYSTITILDTKPNISATGESYTIVVTGELVGWPNRTDFKVLLESIGHKMTGSISGKTTFLVTNDTDTGTVKIKDAIAKGVKVVTELEICEILGIKPPNMEQDNSSDVVSPDTLF